MTLHPLDGLLDGPDLHACTDCGHTFDAATGGSVGEHDYQWRCQDCTVPCHCPTCDPDAATDLALDLAPDWPPA